ncbi:MAG: hypothetical protein HN348_30725 [Proteobacteria bacterium]|jgi:hypothetical protein|nr:hypothetical protein [Pseudomonadota bacterium]
MANHSAHVAIVYFVCGGCPTVGPTELDNAPPEIEIEDAFSTLPGFSRTIPFTITDEEGDEVEITWTAVSGELIVDEVVTYKAGEKDDTIVIIADDGNHNVVTAHIDVTVGAHDGFSPPEPIAITEGNAKSPSTAILDDGSIHVVWHDFTEDPTALHHAIGQDGEWTSTLMNLHDGKCIRPRLLAEGDQLHLWWDQWTADKTTVYYSSWTNGSWSAAQEVAIGEKPSGAFLSDGSLHVIYFTESGPAHSQYIDGVWVDGDTMPTNNYINDFRLRLVAIDDRLEAVVATSPGEVGYDIRLYSWTAAQKWSFEPLHTSQYSSSDEPEGSLDFASQPYWVWTEQTLADEWTFGVAIKGSEEEQPSWVTKESGSSMSPTVTIPPDKTPIVAWINPRESISLARAPFNTAIDISDGRGAGPQLAVDAEGFTHLVYYAYDDSSQQIWYSTNRP